MPDSLTERTEKAIASGKTAAEFAANARKSIRRSVTPGSEQREAQIGRALDEIKFAMEPIRSLVAKSMWEPLPEKLYDELRATSKALQYEARQLKKMRR